MHLMKSCDGEACRVIKTIKSRTIEINMVRFGKWSISINNRIMDRPVRGAVRIIDAMQHKSNKL